MTRMPSGSRSSTSATTVETMVSCPCPEDDVPIIAVIEPLRSTRNRQESIQVVVSFFGLNRGSNAELPPLGSRQVEMPSPASRSEEHPSEPQSLMRNSYADSSLTKKQNTYT